MVQANMVRGSFPPPDVSFHGPEWAKLAKMLTDRLEKHRSASESMEIDDRKRYGLACRIDEIKEILSLPELLKLEATMRAAQASFLNPDDD